VNHFCEKCGPSPLYFTERRREDLQIESLPGKDNPEISAYGGDFGSSQIRHQGNQIDNETWSKLLEARKRSIGCQPCKPPEMTAISFESNDGQKIAFVSPKVLEPSLSIPIRRAALRSLSGEYVGPGREGPVFFGDEFSGHVFAYVFKLKDAQARGYIRWLSITYLGVSADDIISYWKYLTWQFRHLAQDLQLRSAAVFEQEVQDSRNESMNEWRMSSRNAPATGPYHLRHRAQVLRPFQELLQMPDLFSFFHGRLCWILSRLRQHLSAAMPEPVADLTLLDHLSSFGSGNIDLVKAKATRYPSLSVLTRRLAFKHVVMILQNLYIGNQVVVRGNDADAVVNLLGVLKCLLPTACATTVSFSEDYRESYECNLLGVSGRVELPAHVEHSLSEGQTLLVDFCARPNEQGLLTENVVIRGAEIEGTLPLRIANLLTKHLSDEVIIMQVKIELEKWISAARILYVYSRSRSSGQDRTSALLRSFGMLHKDLRTLKFLTRALKHRV
jgi:folliculin